MQRQISPGGKENRIVLQNFQPHPPFFKDADCHLVTVPTAALSLQQCDMHTYCLVVDGVTCGFFTSRLVELLGQTLEADTPIPSQLIIGKLNTSGHYRDLSRHMAACDQQIDPRLFCLACSLELGMYPQGCLSDQKQRYGFPDVPNLGIFGSLEDRGWVYDAIFPENDYLSCLEGEWVFWAKPSQR